MRLLSKPTRRTQAATGRDGSTMTETAFVLPIFFLILFGFIEFGHVFMTIHTLNSAARRAGAGPWDSGDRVGSASVYDIAVCLP